MWALILSFTLYFGTMILLALGFSFRLTFNMDSLWSGPQSAPGLVLAERIQLLHLLLPITWSVWFLCLPSADAHVSSGLFGCLKPAFVMDRLLALQKSTSWSPASFLTPNPNFPTIFDSALFPTFAFQLPVIIRMSSFGEWSFSS